MIDLQKIRAVKACVRCKVTQLRSAFVQDRRSRDGLQSYCRSCANAAARKYRHTEAGRALRREYKKRPYVRAQMARRRRERRASAHPTQRALDRRHAAKFKMMYPEKVLARQTLQKAVSRGLVKRPANCSSCCLPSRRTLHGHHDDYSKPLDVVWLCGPCHRIRHEAAKEKE
jgi:hypothetical protein